MNVSETKPFKSYSELAQILIERGMQIGDAESAEGFLARVGYYSLSGYSRVFLAKNGEGNETNNFQNGTNLDQVKALWEFDNRLRSATFALLQNVETYIRALLGHWLGEIDPLVYKKPSLLNIDSVSEYNRWIEKLNRQIRDSRESFIVHHRENRDSKVPIWVAVDVLDWGGLSYLYSFSPASVRAKVAETFGITGPQLKTWLRALNVVRNTCAHHGRFYNRYYSLTPKLPRDGSQATFASIADTKDSTFAMLTILQHLALQTQGANLRLLPTVLESFPSQSGRTIEDTGAPVDWKELPLWV
ncbi:abortive infection bacteriophage resistance protein [Aurantimicrobium minutum]|uniref:Abi family protein n=1 Tax=Aurantimicrobium minutum TaxID=708131 RepID=UPI0024758C2D|nr:Abi family protein [Aurantimicrobium minutum]MDH6277277.1 abortive infection bacteriophage resistance protein [Aurantimicrobium minutum]